MKVQLIHPPLYLNVEAMTALRPSLPLGLAYIAATLREAGHEVAVLDAVGEAPNQVTQGARNQLFALGLTIPELIARLDADADVFGLTNMWSFSWPLVRELVQEMKKAYPDTPILCGGEHFTGLPDFSFEQAPIDFIALGEGEETAVAVLEALQRGDTDYAAIDGLVFRGPDGKAQHADKPRRERNKAVDELPWPAWDLFKVHTYTEQGYINGVNAGMTIPILATRGCPYQCTYCANPGMWGIRWYARDAKDVVDEIESYYQTYGATNFPFQDLTAILKKDWILEFCRELLARKLPITWQFPSGTRCEVVDDEVAELLRKTGGRSMAFAPESGSERTRKLIKKQMKTEALMKAVHASVRNGLNISTFMVIGFPHDTREDLKDTVRLVRKLARAGIDDSAVGFFFPIPNTQLYRELMASGRIQLDDDFLLTPVFANEKKLLPENNYCEHLSAKELTRWKYKLLLHFYATSFACRPWRLVRIVFNAVRGKETSKMETFLSDMLRRNKGALFLRGLFGRKKSSERTTASAAPA